MINFLGLISQIHFLICGEIFLSKVITTVWCFGGHISEMYGHCNGFSDCEST